MPHMPPGRAIVNTSSVNARTPNPHLLAYATTKGAIANFTTGLAQLLADKGIRANAVAPGPIWTPLIPSTMSEDAVEKFGENYPMKRPGQPAGRQPFRERGDLDARSGRERLFQKMFAVEQHPLLTGFAADEFPETFDGCILAAGNTLHRRGRL